MDDLAAHEMAKHASMAEGHKEWGANSPDRQRQAHDTAHELHRSAAEKWSNVRRIISSKGPERLLTRAYNDADRSSWTAQKASDQTPEGKSAMSTLARYSLKLGDITGRKDPP